MLESQIKMMNKDMKNDLEEKVEMKSQLGLYKKKALSDKINLRDLRSRVLELEKENSALTHLLENNKHSNHESSGDDNHLDIDISHLPSISPVKTNNKTVDLIRSKV